MGDEGTPAPGAALRLQVKTLAPATHAVELPRGAGLGALRGALEPLTGVPPARQRLLFLGRALRGDGGLEAAGVRDGSVLHMVETPEGAGPGAGGAPGGAEGVDEGAPGAPPGVPQLHINADLHISSDSLGEGGGGLEAVLPLERLDAYTSHVKRGLDSMMVAGGGDGEVPQEPQGGDFPQDLRHYEVQCDGCDLVPIRGRRYKSLSHPNYDLCEACWERGAEQGSHGPFACLALPLPPFQPVDIAASGQPSAQDALRRDLEAIFPGGVPSPAGVTGGGRSELEMPVIQGVGRLATDAIHTAVRAAGEALRYAEELSRMSNEGPLDGPRASRAEGPLQGPEYHQSCSLHLAAYLHSAATLLAESARIAHAVNVFPSQPGAPAFSPLLLAQEGYVHQDTWHPRLRPNTGGVMGTVQALLSQALLSQTAAGPPGSANPQAAEAPPAAPTGPTIRETGAQGAAAQGAHAQGNSPPAIREVLEARQGSPPRAQAQRVATGLQPSGTDGADGGEGGKPEPEGHNDEAQEARGTVNRSEAPNLMGGASLPERKSKAKVAVKAAPKEVPPVDQGSSAPASTPAAGGPSSSAPALPGRPAVKAKARPSASAKASKRGVAARRKPEGGAPVVQERAPVPQGGGSSMAQRQTLAGTPREGAIASPAAPMDPLASLLGGGGAGGPDIMGMVSQMAQSPAFASMAGQMMGQMAGGSGSDSGGDGVPDLGGMMEQMMPMMSQMFGGPLPGGAAQGAPRPATIQGDGGRGAGQGDPWAALQAEERAAWQSALQADRERIRGVDIPSDLSHVYIAGDPAFIDSLGGASA